MNKKQKTKIKKYITCFLLFLILFWGITYLSFAYFILEVNPLNWNKQARGMYVYVNIALAIMAIVISRIVLSEIDE